MAEMRGDREYRELLAKFEEEKRVQAEGRPLEEELEEIYRPA